MSNNENKGTYTAARKKANKKYMDTLSEIRVRVPKDEKKRYTDAARAAGMSLNRFMLTAADEKIDRDGLEDQDQEKEDQDL